MKQTLQDFKSELFKALAHPARIRILERLRTGEKTVSQLQTELGVEANSVSQQLALLRAKHIVMGRKDGTSVYYQTTDPNIFVLLDAARAIFDTHLVTLQEMAGDEPVAESSQPYTARSRS